MTEIENDQRWNEYFIPGTQVLKNKFGITDNKELHEKEIEVTFDKMIELQENPINMGFTLEHYKAIHKYLFEDLYDFAGEYRKANMAKNLAAFASVENIEPYLEDTFSIMKEEEKHIHSKYEFAIFLSNTYAQLIQIHPFREGNGRTTREFIREYANEKSKDLQFGPIDFRWDKIDKEKINGIMDTSIAFRSYIETEFLNAMVDIPNEKANNTVQSK